MSMSEANREVDSFGVPHVMTSQWMRAHIAELQCKAAAADAEYQQHVQRHPSPEGEHWHRAWALLIRREGCLGLIERHTHTMRSLEASEAQASQEDA